jgi:hypothetical protein
MNGMHWMMNDAIRGSRETVQIKAANFTDWLADTQVRIIGCLTGLWKGLPVTCPES